MGGGSGDATPLKLNRKAQWQADGVKDAGETGAGAATTERGGGQSSECDRLADFLGHKALLCSTPSGRRMGRWGRREAAGFPGTGGPAQRVPVLGREWT